MSNNTTPGHALTPTQEANVQQLVEAGNQLSIANAAVMDSFDAIKAIGHIESAIFLRQVADKLIAETAIRVRESKKFKGLPYKDVSGNMRYVADFPEYCEAFLGKSYRRTMELISNYNQLGPDLYEQAERLGFRQRDYNALKALPHDDKLLIAQAIEEESLDKALDLMQEMAAKHHREKEAANKQVTDLTETLEAKDKVIKDKTQLLDSQAERLALLEKKRKQEPVEEQAMPGEYQLMRLQEYSRELTVKITATLNSEIAKLYKEFEGQPPKPIELAARQAVGLIITAAYGVAENMGFEPILEPEQAADEPGRAEAKAFEAYLASQNEESKESAEGHDIDDPEDFADFFEAEPAVARHKKDTAKPLIDYSDEDWDRLNNAEA